MLPCKQLGWYKEYFDRIAAVPYPKNPDDEQAFTDLLRYILLRYILQDNSAVIETTSRGVIQVRAIKKGLFWYAWLINFRGRSQECSSSRSH